MLRVGKMEKRCRSGNKANHTTRDRATPRHTNHITKTNHATPQERMHALEDKNQLSMDLERVQRGLDEVLAEKVDGGRGMGG